MVVFVHTLQQLITVAFCRMILPVSVAFIHLFAGSETLLRKVNQLTELLSFMLDIGGIQRHDDFAGFGEPVVKAKKQNPVG